MRDLLSPTRWYHVYAGDGAEERAARMRLDLVALAKALPHGSGLDGNWFVGTNTRGTLVLQTEFHAMDEHGAYDGWRPIRATLRRATVSEYQALRGPCAGQYQRVVTRGTLRFAVSTRGDLGDDLYDRMEHALRDAGILTPNDLDMPIVSRAEMEADTGRKVVRP